MFFLVLFCQNDGKRFELVKAQANGGKFPVNSTSGVASTMLYLLNYRKAVGSKHSFAMIFIW